MRKDWKGGIIAEGLSDSTIINKFSIHGASISKDDMPIDYKGNVGSWHGYDVKCSRQEIDALQQYILLGWYAHFWKGNRIIVVFNDKQFKLDKNDKSTWKEAIEHGKKQGIPEKELDFPTEGKNFVKAHATTKYVGSTNHNLETRFWLTGLLTE